MSHEIRTPLGVIRGYSEMLANPDQTKANTLHSASQIRKNVEHLTELIDEILDISKIEAGKLEVERIKFALLPELAESFAFLKSRAEGHGLNLSVTFESEIPEFVISCPKRLRQILFNIVGNALKFTERGEVNVAISYLGTRDSQGHATLTFVVKDSGCGLTPEQQKRLFQPFSQADNSVTRRFGGTGLGLILARRLAEALGGDVVLTESKIGSGSTFTFTLDPGANNDDSMLKGVTQEVMERNSTQISDWFVENRRLEGFRILLVEDGPDNQELIAYFLSASGAEVAMAKNGAEGIEMANASAHDLILMDIQMPVLDGYEATKRLREAGYETPIIALTAHAMHGVREKCIAAGFNDYIGKPIKPNELIEVATRVIKKKI